MPVAVLGTDAFVSLGEAAARALGMPHLQLTTVPHPIGGIDPKVVRAKAETIVDRVIAALTRDPVTPTAAPAPEAAAVVAAPADLDGFQDFAVAEGWSDGLPVLPPTEERVARLLGRLAQRRGEVVATLAPRRGIATLEAIAVNAALAGALPEHLPVIVAAIRAVAEPRFNLYAIQTIASKIDTEFRDPALSAIFRLARLSGKAFGRFRPGRHGRSRLRTSGKARADHQRDAGPRDAI